MSSTFIVAVIVAATDDDESVEFKDVFIKYHCSSWHLLL